MSSNNNRSGKDELLIAVGIGFLGAVIAAQIHLPPIISGIVGFFVCQAYFKGRSQP